MQAEVVTPVAQSRSASSRALFDQFAYWCGCLLLSGAVAFPSARSFEAPSLWARIFGSVLYLLASAGLAFVYARCSRKAKWSNVAIGAVIMLVTSAVTFSVVRQDVVLIVFASLFSLPGAVFGAAWPLLRSRPVS